MEQHADEPTHALATLGLEHGMDGELSWGDVTLDGYTSPLPGWPSASCLLTLADILVGHLAARRTAPRISVTVGLEVRVLRRLPPEGRLRLEATLVKSGTSTSVGETRVLTAGGDLVAISVGTFVASPRPTDRVSPAMFSRMERPLVGARTAPTLVDHVGIRTPEPGVAEIDVRPEVLNGTGSLQGGLVALLGEVAASSKASEVVGSPQVVDFQEVHYLAAARTGPVRARAETVSASGEEAVVRVAVHDLAREDRLASLIFVTTRAAP